MLHRRCPSPCAGRDIGHAYGHISHARPPALQPRPNSCHVSPLPPSTCTHIPQAAFSGGSYQSGITHAGSLAHSQPCSRLINACLNPSPTSVALCPYPQAASSGGSSQAGLAEATAVEMCQGGDTAAAFAQAFSFALNIDPGWVEDVQAL